MKKYRFLILTLVAAAFVGATVLLWKPITSFAADPEILSSWVSSAGIWGPLVFSALNILQVIFAVIPGAPFEIAAGYLFGVVPGAILCDATMTIGSVLVFLMVRRFGVRFVELFVSREQMEKFPVLSDPRKAQSVFFFIFLIPATPKDVVTYLAGLTGISLKSWIFVCFVGWFPAVLLTTLGGSAWGNEKYGIVAVVIALFAVCYLFGMRWYKQWTAASEGRRS
ncbi:TVP38/TMEM64 family protein [Gemmiger sp.]|uniref:TVP38/TMEM64 family protein n=1 Tax=Gemmiger sp. TaxID=2049027 RepID=UPI003F0E4748